MNHHKPVCISLTIEEIQEVKRVARMTGTTVSEWIGMQIRKTTKTKLKPRNKVGKPAKNAMQ